MDMQKEREAFESHLKKMGKTDNETFSKNEDDSYQMDIIHFGWKIWQAAKAQAVPEGFVLVPLDVIERCMSHICLAMCHQNNSNSENDAMEMDLEVLESALESQEPK